MVESPVRIGGFTIPKFGTETDPRRMGSQCGSKPLMTVPRFGTETVGAAPQLELSVSVPMNTSKVLRTPWYSIDSPAMYNACHEWLAKFMSTHQLNWVRFVTRYIRVLLFFWWREYMRVQLYVACKVIKALMQESLLYTMHENKGFIIIIIIKKLLSIRYCLDYDNIILDKNVYWENFF